MNYRVGLLVLVAFLAGVYVLFQIATDRPRLRIIRYFLTGRC